MTRVYNVEFYEGHMSQELFMFVEETLSVYKRGPRLNSSQRLLVPRLACFKAREHNLMRDFYDFGTVWIKIMTVFVEYISIVEYKKNK